MLIYTTMSNVQGKDRDRLLVAMLVLLLTMREEIGSTPASPSSLLEQYTPNRTEDAIHGSMM